MSSRTLLFSLLSLFTFSYALGATETMGQRIDRAAEQYMHTGYGLEVPIGAQNSFLVSPVMIADEVAGLTRLASSNPLIIKLTTMIQMAIRGLDAAAFTPYFGKRVIENQYHHGTHPMTSLLMLYNAFEGVKELEPLSENIKHAKRVGLYKKQMTKAHKRLISKEVKNRLIRLLMRVLLPNLIMQVGNFERTTNNALIGNILTEIISNKTVGQPLDFETELIERAKQAKIDDESTLAKELAALIARAKN